MKDFKLVQELDGSWDIDSTATDQILIDGIDAYKQRIMIKIAHLNGEWYLDTTLGTFGPGVIGTKGDNAAILKRVVRDTIESDSETKSIKSITVTVDRKTRKASVKAEIDTIYGPLDEEVFTI